MPSTPLLLFGNRWDSIRTTAFQLFLQPFRNKVNLGLSTSAWSEFSSIQCCRKKSEALLEACIKVIMCLRYEMVKWSLSLLDVSTSWRWAAIVPVRTMPGVLWIWQERRRGWQQLRMFLLLIIWLSVACKCFKVATFRSKQKPTSGEAATLPSHEWLFVCKSTVF